YSVAMTLSSMVLSRDWQEVSVLECILGGLQIGVDIESHPERAWAKLSKSKVDALIVDCDLKGADSFLRQLQENSDHGSALPVVIVSGSRGQHHLGEKGAVFTFEKPISVEQAVRTLSAARTLILDGRLRYHRAGLEVPVSLNSKGSKPADAYLVNVSQGGMQIRTSDPVEKAKGLHVSFELPGAR